MNSSKYRRIVFFLATVGLLAVVMIIPLSRPTHAAGSWYVARGGDDSDLCTSPGTACATINGALGKPGFVISDTILVASGTYTGTGSSEVVLLDKNVTLSGGWDASFVTQSSTSTIDGEGARGGITVNSGVTAIVERFTVQNGSGSGHSNSGGGIYNDQGTLTLKSSFVSGNTAYQGGGIFTGSNSTLTLTNSIVSGNTGTGISMWVGTLTLNNSTLSGNTGGGISNDGGGTLTLNNSTVSGNTGTGIFNGYALFKAGTVTLNNSTVSGNTTSWRGGGIYNIRGTLTLNNSTVSGNTAGDDGGGICDFSGTTTLQNTILAGNAASGAGPDCSGTIGSSGYNLIENTSGCNFTPGTDDLTNIDSRLGPLEGSPGYHPLLPDSPAINAGNPGGCLGSAGLLTTDQRGFPRLGRCDIGAYEVQPFDSSTKTVNQSTALPGDPLAYTIALNNGETINITNVWVTDTLPISLTYIDNSLTATGGSYGYNSDVITWTGSVDAGGAVTITFGATVSQTAAGTSITNSAVISGGGETITRTVTVDIFTQVFLPIILRSH